MVYAAVEGDVQAFEAWLSGGGHVDARDKRVGSTMLMAASFEGNAAMVAALLQRGASVDLQNTIDDTALMRASHPAVVRQLLTAGADPALRNKYGDTAADIAERLGYTAIVEILPPTAAAMAATAAAEAEAFWGVTQIAKSDYTRFHFDST